MKACYVVAFRIGFSVLGLDLIKSHRCGIHNTRPRRAVRKKLCRYERARVETYGTTCEEITSADRDEIGGARACANKMNRHDLFLCAFSLRAFACGQCACDPFR